MPFVKGSTHSVETKAKMSAAHKGRPHSDERKAKIGAANKGRVRERVYARTCACGTDFIAGASNAVFCSRKCGRAARGHGLRHAPAFAGFPQECAICTSKNELVGDHDHATGRPRGILCRQCNLALGNLGDSPARLRAGAAYLERSVESRPKRVYVAGPMSGIPDLNFPAFHAAAAELRALGHDAVNPAEINGGAGELTTCAGMTPEQLQEHWRTCMRNDITQLCTCDSILMLPGWQKSKGATLEHHIATQLGLQVAFHWDCLG